VHDVLTDESLDLPRLVVPEEGVLVADGLFCQRPELDGCWDAVVFLDVPFPVSVARTAWRDGGSPDPYHPDQRRYVDAQWHYLAGCRPQQRADLVVDNS
jgi:uridine kinase